MLLRLRTDPAGVQSCELPCFAQDDRGATTADCRWRHEHFDPELVCVEVWSDDSRLADSRRISTTSHGSHRWVSSSSRPSALRFLIRVWKLRSFATQTAGNAVRRRRAGRDARAHSPGDGVLMSVIAAGLLTLLLFLYIFWPERNPFVQADKTRVRLPAGAQRSNL